LLGGSEGGTPSSLLAARLAANGFPTLELAYFKAPGLPQTLTNIPLEYFEHALEWLGKQPQVDPRRIAVIGISRGSEAALLLGVHYPSLVHAVIPLVPSGVVNCGIVGGGRVSGCIGPAWTLNGKPLPYTHEFDNPKPTDVPAAVIPVERIRGPVLLACGRLDVTWNSCEYARAIVDRMRSKGAAPSFYAYPSAGHGVGALLPDEPGYTLYDGNVPGDEQARERLWPHVRSFLAALRP
jgi:dienelactone hydrolase